MILLYTGDSLLQPGAPIFAALTTDTDNRKTGAMLQVWILRADQHPVEALHTGDDAAVCGSCTLRPAPTGRACYVNVHWAPAAVYRAFQAGHYTDATGDPRAFQHALVRLGAYGDPAALPWFWWVERLRHAAGWTGYTHAWRTCNAAFRMFCMASVETREDMIAAQALGYRTFRVRQPIAPREPGEFTCPASAEAGHRLTCAACRLCNGRPRSRRREFAHITILAHGPSAGAFARGQQGVLPW